MAAAPDLKREYLQERLAAAGAITVLLGLGAALSKTAWLQIPAIWCCGFWFAFTLIRLERLLQHLSDVGELRPKDGA